PRQPETRDLRSAVGSPLEEKVDPPFALRSRSAGRKGRVSARTFVNEPFHRPCLAAVEARPHSDALALASRGVEVAEDQDVAFPVREANEPAHAAVGTILASIGKSIDDPPAGPRGAAVLGHRGAAAR